MLGGVRVDCLVGLPVVETSEMMVEMVLGTIVGMIPMFPGAVS